MNPYPNIRSTIKWITALSLGLSLAAGSTQAIAKKQNENNQSIWQLKKQNPKNGQNQPNDNLKPGGNGPDIEPEAKVYFTKNATQLSCKHVRFRIRLAVFGSPGFFDDPEAQHAKEVLTATQQLTDILPKGLSWVLANQSGDIVGAVPTVFQSTNHQNDTIVLNGLQFSPDNADGAGSDDIRVWNIEAIAKIDPAEFPVPKTKINQAELKITTLFGSFNAKSHNPALPAPADWTDGTPTKFLIDLKDCDKPDGGGDHPDDEPCIKIEKGEVECHEGAPVPFTYKMPVGPELAGTTIELTSLTPGVIVNPAFQIVPPGGGVLEWDLLGAAKGMTIHLLTNNVKQVGPADFDGLATCCTEEIIIEIPEDLPCDEKEKEPDLEVIKDALVPVCDKNTGDCKFIIKVKNVGDKKYTGKIALREWQIPHRAAITGGPNAGWNCNYNMGLGLYFCKTGVVTLNPGEKKELKLSFTPGNAWPSDKIKNCAKLDYVKMGVAPFGDLTNDKDCAEICIKGSNECPDEDDDKKPELEIKKTSIGTQCLGGAKGLGACWVFFSIEIHNFGDASYIGPLHVEDTFQTDKPDNVDFSPMPPWNCATVDGKKFDCDHPGINLPPNGKTILSVTAKFNNPTEVEHTVENCAKLEEAVEGKDNDCADGELPTDQDDPVNQDKPDLTLDKQCEPGVLGGLISCRIMVRNNGNKAPKGKLSIFDVARLIGSETPLTSQNVTPDGSEWSCEGEPVPDLVCAIDGKHLTPGTTRYFDAKISLAGNYSERYRNCATLYHTPVQADDRNLIGKKCVEGGIEIRVEKTGPAQCEKGTQCLFDITVKNEGETDYSGTVKFADALGLTAAGMNVPISSINPPLPCATQPTSVPFICKGNLNLNAGESQTYQIALTFPESTKLTEKDQLRNCAAIIDPALKGGANKAKTQDNQNDPENAITGCHEFTIADDKTPTCKAPLIMNDNGACVCPAGTKWNGRRCIGGGDNLPPLIPPATVDPICKVGKGEYRTSNNRCICLPGYIRKGPNLCIPPKQGCKPGRNEYKNRAGECLCLKGYTRSANGYCVKPPVLCKLGPNEFRNSQGQCVCKSGYSKGSSGICTKTPTGCKPGRNEYKNQYGQCVCKPGYDRSNKGYCVKTPTLCKLGPNEFRNSQGQCVCKSGYSKGSSGICVKTPTLCKPGPGEYRDKNGRCVCKSGYSRGKNGICEKPVVQIPPCQSGKLIKRGKSYYCACPKGWKRTPIGKNGGASCYKNPVISTPKPPCYNGRLGKRGKAYYCSCPKGFSRKPIGNQGGASCVKNPIIYKPNKPILKKPIYKKPVFKKPIKVKPNNKVFIKPNNKLIFKKNQQVK